MEYLLSFLSAIPIIIAWRVSPKMISVFLLLLLYIVLNPEVAKELNAKEYVIFDLELLFFLIGCIAATLLCEIPIINKHIEDLRKER